MEKMGLGTRLWKSNLSMESLWRILTLTAGLQLSVAVGLLLAVGYVIYRSAQGRSVAKGGARGGQGPPKRS